MKPPSERELIELENWVADLDYQIYTSPTTPRATCLPVISTAQAAERILLLITIGRNVNRLYLEAQEILQRTSAPEPSPTASAKQKRNS